MSIPSGYLRQERKKTKKFNPINILLILFLVIIIGGIGSYVYFRSWYSNGINKKDTTKTDIVTIEIPPGASSVDIGNQLKEKGLISDLNLWKFYVRLNNPTFLAAKYKVPANLSLSEIALVLQKEPDVKTIWVTFPEGATRQKYVTLMQEKQAEFTEGNFTAASFSDITEFPEKYTFSEKIQNFLKEHKPQGKSLEGFLYPETYAFEPDNTAQEVVEIMLGEFINKTKDLDLSSGGRPFYQTLVLASVVDKESLNETDRPKVASVFVNRLKINMKLQSDATVGYATGKNNPRATYEDLQIDSPYNTYKYAGLPPTPINSPRIESIKHSLNPPQTDFYYFLHAEDGTAYFGKTDTEHYRNVCKYLDKTC